MTPYLYVDANVLIYLLEDNSDWVVQADAMLQAAVAGDLSLVTGDLAVAEVMVMPYRDGDPRAITMTATFFGESSPLTVVPHPRHVFDHAARIRGEHGAGLLDALHVATALAAGCDAVVSHDARMPRLPEMPVLRLDELDLTA